MTFSVAHSSRKQLILAILFAVATAYLAVLLKYNCYFSAGPDSSGYCTEAKMIASGRMSLPVPLLSELQLPPDQIVAITPIGWMKGRVDRTMVPTYPAGVPMHQALLGRLFGWNRAPFLAGPLLAFLALFVFVALMREFGLPAEHAMVGAAIFGLIPSFLEHAMQPVSDSVAAFYSILAIWLAMRASRLAPAIVPAILSGVAFAIGVWVRPTNFLLCIALAFALRWNPRRLIAASIGSVPLGLALAWWNNTLYGSPFRFGYGSFFDVIRRYPVCATFHLRAIGEMLTPFVALGSLFVFFDKRIDGRLRSLIGVWIGSFFLFYSFYDFRNDRFLLPAVPALIAGFLLALRRATATVAAHAPRFAAVVAALVLAALIGEQFVSIYDHHSLNLVNEDSIYPTSIAFAEAHLPGNAIVAAGLMSGAFLYQGRYTIRFDMAGDPRVSLPQLREGAKRAHKQWYALLSVFEAPPERFDVWLPARWVPVGMNENVTLWRLEE
ncbi:MAG TPA: hypothetical protein VF381_06745 [Thermoanaerobaculia bacterium]